MAEKKTALIATVKEREETLKIVIKSIYDQVDAIHVVLNYYHEVPEWLKGLRWKVIPHLNPTNKNAHDAIWSYIPKDGYVFIMDDDLYYPKTYIDKLIETIEKFDRRRVVTAHGSVYLAPVKDYFSRRTYGFSSALEHDTGVDLAGVGALGFHTSTIRPTLQDFPIPFCRDLFFSILCAKRNIGISTPARPYGWIAPLKTPGETVWDMTNQNKKLRDLKNRILKEQLLPLLACDRSNDKYCLITDYDFDEWLLSNTLDTLDRVVNCNKIVFSNRVKDYSQLTYQNGYNILTQYVTEDELRLGRMGSKVLTQYRFINALPDGSKVISADADLHFLKDPFEAFKPYIYSKTQDQKFDIVVTTRPYQYKYPINAGVVMFNVNDRVRRFLTFVMSQLYDLTWQPLIDFQKKFGHTGTDWYIDQDLWCAVYLNRQEILERFDVLVDDIGPSMNYCPHADGDSTEQGKQQLMQAYNEKSVHVLHLKSRLKELLFEGKLNESDNR